MKVEPIPCLRDNYAYLLRADDGKDAAVVDPSEAGPVIRAVDRSGVKLVAILNTHHHWDHVGGNEELVKRFGPLEIYGHHSDDGRIPGQTRKLQHGDTIEVAGLRMDIAHIPGHTTGAIAFVADGAVFTGDTLFAAGCGRLFEGTPAMMYESLNEKLGSLSDDTLVYCGHEYTQKNLRFARELEPSNEAVQTKADRVAALRERNEPTVPSTIGEERATNPFMRCESPELIEHVADRLGDRRDPVSVLAAVRAAKDAF